MRTHLTLTLVLAAVVAGAFFLPVQPVYASSDSMAPTIQQGDLYFVLEGTTVRTGDVITFHSPTHDALVTHRVVGEKPAGYVTMGDANPSTDQAAGHPPVARSDVVGTVVAVNGRPVTLAGLGPLATLLSAFRSNLMTVGILLVSLLWLKDQLGEDRSVPQRPVVTVGDVLTPLFVGTALLGLLLVYWGGSSHDLNYVATAGTVTSVHTVPVGEAAVRTVKVNTLTLPFTTLIVEANGVSVIEQTSTASGLQFLVEVPPQATTGLYRAGVHVSTYPATLPRGAIEWLHGVHWLAAALGTFAPLFAPVYLLYLGLVDGQAPVRWPTSRWFRRVGGL